MATQLASTRQPFAPLNSSRLQTLTSLKNRQNAISSLTPSSKRKAASFDADHSNEDGENIDPAAFLSPKRCKGADVKDGGCKPVNYFLTTSTSSPAAAAAAAAKLPPPGRAILHARSPANPRLEIGGAGVRKTPLSAPAGRSPTRKRAGILHRRKTGGGSSPFTRVDPPKFSSSALSSSLGLGFSIDAALSGTIPGYASRAKEQERERELQQEQEQEREQRQMSSVPALWTDDKPRESWNFEIYEDTEEELATNLMEHGACTLEISSDEESAARERDLRGKENVPPEAEDGGDVSQTSSASSSSTSADAATLAVQSAMKASTNRAPRRGRMQDANAIVIDRCPLGDLPAEDFYAEGCDENTVVLADADVDADADASALITPPADGSENDGRASTSTSHVPASTFDLAAGALHKGKGKAIEIDLDVLMAKSAESGAPGARLLEPLEKAEVGWTVWESGSAKADGEEE
ncbi:uncharacterized protein L3040_002755 [Drepanopeziza brunnea f. sp. 'multigermtubi']|uniref:Thymidylate kinase n=1 Tax=Marssonina brunnea f. sp. multigermtubi (strain MB_m1) TaxID=1072389 RepID=K1W882_MARBU|nr:uncharacterized protein MBM_08468 [Drepanopeziza brunnea f. sp. 'multigermtubi' MB_m1]EKD13385.1 hypothetical protein MBM_08468 [Drepanopeziza brunnea f. sp. 'multigermtubi' MB_m1]KAJ5050887.1 hypothetical protein L3040_002755 [Drepanopeziza brunnea f. sp. 'multigermtubi']